ncbi:MAG: T9SS type A sorting domain-containing protein [bacterium]
MKKILYILSFIAAASSTMAQGGFYHQVGDTVRGKCPIYQYEQGWWPTLNAIGHTDSVIGTINTTFGYMKHTTDTPLRVIGVASTLARLDRSNPTSMQEDMDTSIDGTLYYVLFDATAGGLVEKARVCWSDDYTTHPKRYMELPRRGGAWSCDEMQDHTAIVSLREYYFDSAITVTDSFYLGCVFPDIDASGPNGAAIFSYIASHMWDYCTYASSLNDNDSSSQYKDCAMKVPDFTYYDSSRLDNMWHYTTRKFFQLVFPIIEVDTTIVCNVPGDPQVAYRDSLMVRVEWSDTSNARWEVSRTAPGGNPDAGLITPTTNPYTEYTDIDNDSTYEVYVRGYCVASVWEGWSDWNTPCLIDSLPTPPTPPDSVGIATIETTDFFLFPNPTTGKVTIQVQNSNFIIQHCYLTDLTGRREEVRLTLDGPNRYTLDLTSRPQDTYLLTLTTADGYQHTVKLIKQSDSFGK